MKAIATLYILILTVALSFGQGKDCNCNSYAVNEDVLQEKPTQIIANAEIKGLPKDYLFNSWANGDLLLNNGELVKNKIIHYDGISDQLYIFTGNTTEQSIIENTTVQGFYIQTTEGKVFFRRMKIKYWFQPDSTIGYAQVLAEGKISVYVHRRIEQNSSGTQLHKVYTYFMKLPDGKLYPLNANRSSFLSLLPTKQEEFKAILKSEHLRCKDDEQLAKAAELYNLGRF
jgi:hypothetical protein